MRVCECVCVCMCVYMWVFTSLDVDACVCVCVCVCVCMWVFTSLEVDECVAAIQYTKYSDHRCHSKEEITKPATNVYRLSSCQP